MKRHILILAALVLTLACVLSLGALTVSAEETEPSVTIAKFNLAFEDNTYLKYAVRFDGVADSAITENNIGMLYWTDYEGGFVPGTEDFSSKTTGYTTISGVKHYVFEYTHLAAKQLTDYIYSVAYIELDGTTYYSEPVKYSALEYAYNRLGKTSEGSSNAELKALLNNMLAYGASAQQYFDYKEDRLATSDFFQLKLVGGTLEDGFESGLYLSNDSVIIIAPEVDIDGEVFSHWADSNKNHIATTPTYNLIVGNTNEVYTPIYTHAVVIDTAVAPTCSRTGLTEGSHCSVCGEVIVEQEIVSATGNHLFGEWVTIKEASTVEDGLMERTCECGEKETQIVEKIIPELTFALNVNKKSYSVVDIGTWTDSELVIPDTYNGLPVTGISKSAFAFCTDLTSITIPNSITNIGDYAFQSCSGLTSINIPDSITSIGSWAFNGCSNLIQIENGISYVDRWVVDCDSSVSTAILRENTIGISGDAFTGSGIISIEIPNSVIYIGNYAFYYCHSLADVIIGNHVKSIGYRAFLSCINLSSINIPDSVVSIKASAFESCESLEEVTIGKGVTSIGDSAFAGCYKLSRVYYIGTIDDWENITIGSNNTYITDTKCYYYSEAQPSSNCNYCWHYVNGVPEIYSHVEVTDEAIVPTCTETGLTEGKHCSSCAEILVAQVAVPARHTYYESLTIAPTCSENGYADYACLCGESYSAEIIPSNFEVTANNRHLVGYTGKYSEKLIIPAVFKVDGVWYRVTGIDENAFSSCTNLTSVTIPNSVESLGFCAFQKCSSLKNVIVGNGVTIIDRFVFNKCSSLSHITYEGTVSQWQSITKSAYWATVDGGWLVYCTDGTISKDGTITYY